MLCHASPHLKKTTRLPSRSSVANSRVPKSVSSTSLFRHGMKHVIAAEFVVELIDANNSDATAGGPRNERLGARGNRSFGQVALAPAFVARFPQVQDGLVATHYGKPPVVMQHLETESVAIESDGGGRISNRHGRDRLVEPDAGSHQIGRLDQVFSGSSTISRRGGSHRSRLSTSSSGRSMTTSSSRWLRARKPSETAWSRKAVSPS